MKGNNLPYPTEVISLYKSRNIGKLRLFHLDTNRQLNPMKFKDFLTQDGVNILDMRFLPSLDKIGRVCHLYLTGDHAIFVQNLIAGDGVQSVAQFKKEVLFHEYRISSPNEDCIAFAIDVALLHRALHSALIIQLQSRDEIAAIQIKFVKKLHTGSHNSASFLTFETKGLRSAVVQDVTISKPPLSGLYCAAASQDLPQTMVQVPDLTELQNAVHRLKNVSEGNWSSSRSSVW